jgi:sulfopyruvate decarboxylase TPP-binding subunit
MGRRRYDILQSVMPGLVPGIHVGPKEQTFVICAPTWMAGINPAMTMRQV